MKNPWGFLIVGLKINLKIPEHFPDITVMVFSGGATGKEPACQCRRHRDVGLIPGLGRSPGRGNGSPLQYSCLENPMDREAW